MNDDERAMENAVIAALEPFRDLLARMMALIEQLTARVERLELERLARGGYNDES
jgi:hypothetical protein